MSGVLHPVGPEPAQVYWIRRVLVLGSAVLMLVLVIAVVANLNSAASASGPEAVPAPAGSTSAPVASDSAGSSASSPSGPTPSFSAAASVTSTPAATSTTDAKPSSSATGKSAGASGKASVKSGAKTTPKGKATQVEVAACDPAQLRPTLTGRQSIKVKSKTSLDLSLINGSAKPCRLTLNSANFALTIFSGRDRIWSTTDCTDLVKPTSVKIATEDAYEWRLVWDGRRSESSCKTRPEVPKAGTYVATAQFKGADPVKFRMFLHK